MLAGLADRVALELLLDVHVERIKMQFERGAADIFDHLQALVTGVDEVGLEAVQRFKADLLAALFRVTTQRLQVLDDGCPLFLVFIRRHGIRPTQGTILVSLMGKESWSMADLSDWLGMERTTLVRNLRPLQRDGFVNVGGGGRGNLVELSITAKGRKQVEKLVPAWKSAQSAVVKTLGEKRWAEILSDLETAALALNKK